MESESSSSEDYEYFLDVDTDTNDSDVSSSEEMEEAQVYSHLEKYKPEEAVPAEPLHLARARRRTPRAPRSGSFETSIVTMFDAVRWCALPRPQQSRALDELIRKSKAAREAERQAAQPRMQFNMAYKRRVLMDTLEHIVAHLFLEGNREKAQRLLSSLPLVNAVRSTGMNNFPFVAVVNVNTHGRLEFKRTKRSVRSVTFGVPAGAVISRINLAPHSSTFNTGEVGVMNAFLASVHEVMQSPTLDPINVTSDIVDLTRRVSDARIARTRKFLLSRAAMACTGAQMDSTLERIRFLGQLSNLQVLTFLPGERVLDKVLVRSKADESKMTGVQYCVPEQPPQFVFPTNLDEHPDTFTLSAVVAHLYRKKGVRHFVVVDWSCSNYSEVAPQLAEVDVRTGMSGGYGAGTMGIRSVNGVA